MTATVRDNPAQSRYEIIDDGRLAGFAQYHLHGGAAAFIHTEIDGSFAGRGLATTLVHDALDDVRRRGLTVQPFCPFVRTYIARHREYRELVRHQEWPRFGLDDASKPGTATST